MKTIKLNSSPEPKDSPLQEHDVTTLPVGAVVNILWIIRQPVGGIEYHRLVIPMYALAENPNFKCSQVSTIENNEGIVFSPDFFKYFQIVVFNTYISQYRNDAFVIQYLRKLGLIVVCDIDDYWVLPTNHLMYRNFVMDKTAETITACIKNSSFVCTTTEILQAKIFAEFAIEPVIFENSINPAQPQFQPNSEPSEKIRFGYLASIVHLRDMELLRECFKSLHIDDKLTNKFELWLMGVNPGDKLAIYKRMAEIMTVKGAYHENYHEIQGTNCYTYAKGYNCFDVALAPLESTFYNSCKSELKMIEAGFMKKAIMVSKVLPYTPLAQSDHNCIAVANSTMSGYAWYLGMRRLITNEGLVEDLADQLYEDVHIKYHIDTVTEKRAEFFKTIAK